MRNRIASFLSKTACVAALVFLTFRPFASPAQVGIGINIYYNTYPGESSYYIETPITNASPILTYDEMISPRTNFSAILDSSGGTFYSTYSNITAFSDLADAITNGNWLLIMDAGAPSQRTYSFQVSFTGFTSNDMPGFQVTYPMPEEVVANPNLTFTWAGGPTGYSQLGLTLHNTDYSYWQGVGIDPDYYSSWNFGTPMSGSDTNFYFQVNYARSGADFLAISSPLTAGGQGVPGGWSATSTLNLTENNGTNVDGDGVHFILETNLVSMGGGGGGHTNLLYYSFEDNNLRAYDFSGHGNSVISYTLNLAPPCITTDAAAGSYAAGFAGAAGGAGWFDVPTNLAATLAGSFSASLWARTSEHRGNDSDTADTGSGLMAANSDQVIPIALTGSKLAFLTGGASPDTLHSTASINTGNYVHLVVTRDQKTGIKTIYVNGNLDAAGFGAPGLLTSSSPAALYLGTDTSEVNGYAGDMDEVQIYSGVLSSNEVAYLYSHPGSAVGDTMSQGSGPDFNAALGTTNLSWTTSGDTNWFVETTHTWSSNAAAAESGSVTLAQSSTLAVTVAGPGTITFYWSSIANDPNGGFDCEFYLDGGPDNNYVDDISGDNSWYQDGPFDIPAGQHRLEWTVTAGGDTEPTQAAFLDQVSYVQDTMPVITLNPFNQTNYPGYSVALLAGATGVPDPTWQWYEVDNFDPIPGATSALFIPANSGQSSVAGSYYAVASTPAGSQETTEAQVTFVSAPLPPDWTEAFKSPFANSDNYGTYAANDTYYACTVDSTGANIFSAGISSGTNFFGTNEILNEHGEFAAFIVKQTAATTALWAVTITNNGNGNACAKDIAPAPDGGVYAAGSFSGTNWLGNTLLKDSGQGTYFLAKFDANGNTVWMQTVSNAFPFPNDLVADPAGNVTGFMEVNNSTTIGGSNVTVSGQTAFLAQFSPAGTLNWVESVPEAAFYLQYSAGRIYASLVNGAGLNTNSTIGGLTNNTDRNWTVAAINATNGQGIWLRGVGEGLGISSPYGQIDDYPQIAVSGTNLFLVGTAYGSSAVFGSFTVPIAEGRGQYFARYDTNGNAQLATGFGGATTQPEAAVADANGNVYVAGNFDTYACFGSEVLAAPRLNTLTNSNYGHAGYFGQAFAAEFDRTGTAQWARMTESTNANFESSEMVNLYDIALAPGGVWVCGFGNGATYFGTNLVNSDWQDFVIGFSLYFRSFNSGMLGMIAVTPPAAPVTLLNPAVVGGNFQFQFLSQNGFTHNILYQDTLSAGGWLTNSSVPGDGTLMTISIPLTVFGPSKAGFVRVSTE